MKRLTTLLTGAMLMMTTSAMAIPISGSISFNGTLNLTGPTPLVTASTATGIDFTTDYMSEFIGTGFSAVVVGGKSGDYASVRNFTGVTFTDFTFSPNLSPSPVKNLWAFTSRGTDYGFDLYSIAVSHNPSNTLALNGTGLLHITGFDDTFGTWTLTTQDGGEGDLTFSAASVAPVPEPGTMVLLGFGLVGLAIYGKRRMNKDS